MNAESITLYGYRNIEDARIEFSPGVNLIYGNNAQGKTNVLEAIYTFARGKSFRGASDKELVKFGGDGYRTELCFRDKERTQTMEISYHRGKRERTLNGVKCERVSDSIGRFRAVMFCPEHLEIVKGGPSQRREFLNIAISQLDPLYIKMLSSFRLAVDERNALLRQMAGADRESRRVLAAQLDVFSAHAAKAAAYINEQRDIYLRKLTPYAEFFLGEMTGEKEKLTLSYESDLDEPSLFDRAGKEEAYLSKMRSNTEREIGAGATLYGIHRDDICVKINDTDARAYASQGQQRSVALAMKMAEGEMSRSAVGEYPVFLFDDVLSELDAGRRQYLLSKISERQLIITGCNEEELSTLGEVRRIRAQAGKYEITRQ